MKQMMKIDLHSTTAKSLRQEDIAEEDRSGKLEK
jgi:hypothetical protein